MNALAEMPRVSRPALAAAAATLPPASSRMSYLGGLVAALGVHAAILFAWPPPAPVLVPVEFGVELAESSVEVSLVAALPAEEPAPVVETPPEPVPLPPAPVPEPPPVESPPPEPVARPAMTVPEPEPPKVVRREKPRAEPQPAPKPRAAAPAARPIGDGSSAVPGRDATTAVAAAGAASVKPSYLRNPHPVYPEAARAARQQGTVMLQVRVDEQGKVSGIRVSRSSGFPLLDESARSTVAERWKFRPAKAGGVPVASNVTIPIRFTFSR